MKYTLTISFDAIKIEVEAGSKGKALAVAIERLKNIKIDNIIQNPRSIFIDEPFNLNLDEQH